MRRFQIGFILGALAMGVASNGCFIGVDDFSRTCVNNSTCPKVGGYLCASSAKWPQAPCDITEKGCLCEVKFPPEPYDAGSAGGGAAGGGTGTGGGTGGAGGAGGGTGTDAGLPPDYCTQIRPTVQAKCLFTCHSSQMVYPNSPVDFRLDYYEISPDRLPDGGMLPGLKARAGRAYARMSDNSMPPDQQVFPGYTAAEKALFSKWINAGLPFGSGDCESPKDAGVKMDAGMVMDAGPQLSFATDIQPIFNARCTGTCHTAAALNGGLNLTTGNSYAALVSQNTSGNCNGGLRVVPFDPKSSQLWKKMTPDGGYCLNVMPRNLMPLRVTNPAEFNRIELWITQGAKNN